MIKICVTQNCLLFRLRCKNFNLIFFKAKLHSWYFWEINITCMKMHNFVKINVATPLYRWFEFLAPIFSYFLLEPVLHVWLLGLCWMSLLLLKLAVPVAKAVKQEAVQCFCFGQHTLSAIMTEHRKQVMPEAKILRSLRSN